MKKGKKKKPKFQEVEWLLLLNHSLTRYNKQSNEPVGLSSRLVTLNKHSDLH